MNSNHQRFVHYHRFLPLALSVLVSPIAMSNVGIARAQCDYYSHPCTTQPTTYANGVIEGPVAPPSGQPANTDLAYTRGHNASVAIDDSETSNNGFVVAWVSDFYRQGCVPDSELLVEYNKILFSRFDSNGACLLCPRTLSGLIQLQEPLFTTRNVHALPSVAITGHEVRVAWVGVASGSALGLDFGPVFGGLLVSDFDETSNPNTWPVPIPFTPTNSPRDFTPSAAISDDTTLRRSVSYGEYGNGGNIRSMFANRTPGSGPITILDSSDCGTNPDPCEVRTELWQPCVASYLEYTVVVWAQAESSSDNNYFNIHMELIDPSGSKVIGGDGLLVNETGIEQSPSSQNMPSVDFYENDIVVAWRGDPLPSPCSQAFSRIYARVLHWAGGNTVPEAVGGQIMIDTSTTSNPTLFTSPNPTVAISRQGNDCWIAAWNAVPNAANQSEEIHAQYFNGIRPVGTEFRVNQDTNIVGFDQSPISGCQCNTLKRRLGNSNQHTIAYGRDGEVVCVWASIDEPIAIPGFPSGTNNEVYFTRLPPGYADTLDPLECCKGDFDGQGDVDGNDIQGFVDVWNGGGPRCQSVVQNFCPADINNDGNLDNYDVDEFTTLLLAYPPTQCAEAIAAIYDCNNNQVDDATDIANQTSADCNINGYPDECDVLLWPPFNATDCNNNGVPDECDVKSETSPDCNENGIPDSCDIAAHTSRDVNRNGIPDECDSGIEDLTMAGMTACPTTENLDTAWLAFYEWSIQQCWGPNCPLTGAEQYQAIVDKKCELGLPMP